MVVPTITIAGQALRDTDGQISAYIVPAEELDRLRAEVESLREQVATLQRRNDRYVREMTEMLRTYIPIPPTEEEMLAAVDNSHEVRKIIADLESQ